MGLAQKSFANAGPAQNGPGQRRPEDVRERPRRKRLSAEERARRSRVGKAAPLCPLRPGEPCTLCQAFVTGPQDCQTVRMVMEDPDLREILAEKRCAYNQARRAKRAQVAD